MAWTRERRREYHRIYGQTHREQIRANARLRYKRMTPEERLESFNLNRDKRLAYSKNKYHSMTEEQKKARKEYDNERYLKSKNFTIKQ